MSFRTIRIILAALACLAASTQGSAQPIYKCGSAAAPSYSDRPCSHRVVNVDEAPVTPGRTPEWTDQNRALVRSMHRLRGESEQQFAVRRRRARLLAADRAECARLDKRIDLEATRTKSVDAQEAAQGVAGLQDARKEFAHVGC